MSFANRSLGGRASSPARPRTIQTQFRLAAALVCLRAACLIPLGPSVSAETTKTWDQTSFEHFEKGRAQGVSIRSDGKLLLAPRVRKLHEAPSSYFQALAVDRQGNIYAGGGPEAEVLRITPQGETTVLFQGEAVSVDALAVGPDGALFAAVSPEAKVFRIDEAGDISVFFDPQVDYIWDMAFDADGNLFLACGSKGRIFRVRPSGEGDIYFDTEQTHVRSIVLGDRGELIAGADPGGLILRIVRDSPDAEPRGFVLHQSGKKEITALVRAADATIYAAAVGNRAAAAPPPPPPSAPASSSAAPPQTAIMPGAAVVRAPPRSAVPPTRTFRVKITGGSEVYRLRPGGQPEVVWRSAKDIVYALAMDAAGQLVIGSGDRGRLLRMETKNAWSLALSTPSQQITALASGRDGRLFAATGNIGAVYELGPGPAPQGTFVSEPFDAGIVSEWGRIEWRGVNEGLAGVSVSTRSGNLRGPGRHWSGWSAPVTEREGGPAGSPASRFLQWRATLTPAAEGRSPILESVRLYYLPKNIAPRLVRLEMTEPNHRFVSPPNPPAPRNRNLPPLGVKTQAKPPGRPSRPHIVSAAKGHVGARWAARDDNRDQLIYKLEIRGESESEWKDLESELATDYYSWDSTAFPDGRYRVRVTVSDRPSNPRGQDKADTLVGEPFLIDNSAPRLSNLSADRIGARLRVRLAAVDEASKIRRAQYSIDGGEWISVAPTTRLFDSGSLSFDFETEEVDGREHTVAVRVGDSRGNVTAGKALVRRLETADAR